MLVSQSEAGRGRRVFSVVSDPISSSVKVILPYDPNIRRKPAKFWRIEVKIVDCGQYPGPRPKALLFRSFHRSGLIEIEATAMALQHCQLEFKGRELRRTEKRKVGKLWYHKFVPILSGSSRVLLMPKRTRDFVPWRLACFY